jgi:tetratricopeptide (TPR) repeat protein
VWGAGSLVAEEPASTFLNALRENQYNDAALLYLDRMEADPRTPAEFRAEIPFQRGVTMIQAASLERDRAVRESRLNVAKENLERFLREQPDHPKKSSARRQFGFLLREWARMKMEQAARTGEATMRKEAAGLYDEAYQVFDSAATELKDQLAKLKEQPDPAAADGASERLEALRAEYLDSLLRRAETLEDKADTEPADSAERKKLLNDAIRLYGEMYSKYQNRLAGVQARLNEARALVKLGDFDKALKYVDDDVINQADINPPLVRKLITKGFLLAMDCWLLESRKEYPRAITRTTPWLSQIRPAEDNDPDWVTLKLQLAKANRAYADELQAKDPRDPQIKAARDEARKLAREVSRAPGGNQEEARTVLAGIPGGVAGARVEQKPAATTFEEAKTNAVEAMSEMQSEQFFLTTAPGRLEKETDEGVKEELRQQLAAAQQSVTRNRESAMENLQLALHLADAQTPLDDLNLVRRLLAYLDYMREDYYDAAVLGEFVGRKFPGSAGAQTSAQIALAAYLKLYEANESEDKQFESGHIVSLANYIVETWAGSPEAAEAINTLIPFLISRGEMAKAREYVQSIPENSPQRASAELRIGESLWRDYLVGMDQVRQWEREVQEPDAQKDELNANIARRKPELEELKKTALNILESGVERMRQSGTVDTTVPRAVLALAQIYVNLDQAPKAIALLDDEKIGVLPMVQRNDAAIDTPALREHAYRVALSAVVAALPKVTGGAERAALIERSQQLMQSLRTEVGDTPEAQQRLVEIFYSLARGLETQIKLLDRPEDRRLLSDGFSVFLEQVRAKASDLRVLNWVAESYAGLGSGLADDKASTDAARICFVSAVETYRQILTNAESLGLTPELRRQLQVRQALAQRSAGQFEEAIQSFKNVLSEDGGKVNVQVDAAMTFQLWAAEPKQALKYKSAISGAEPDPVSQKEILWGWNRIAQATARYKDYREVYHQARYNAAVCYYEYSLCLRKPEEREKYLKFAKDCIVFTQRLNPQLGGSAWQAKYDALLKKIQRALRESPVGLATTAAKK